MIAADFTNAPRRVNFGWIGESFQIFCRDAGTWILAMLITGSSSIAISLMLKLVFSLNHVVTQPTVAGGTLGISPLPPGYWALLGTSSLIGLPLNAFFNGGLFKMANKAVRGQRLDIVDVFSGGPTVLRYIGFNILFGICYYIGLLGILVGSLVVTALLYPGFALIADGESVTNAFSRSIDGMKKDWLNGAAFVFVFGLLFFATLFCLLPIFVTVPMALIIASLAYRDMIGMPVIGGEIDFADVGGLSWPPKPSAPPTPVDLSSPTDSRPFVAEPQVAEPDETPDMDQTDDAGSENPDDNVPR